MFSFSSLNRPGLLAWTLGASIALHTVFLITAYLAPVPTEPEQLDFIQLERQVLLKPTPVPMEEIFIPVATAPTKKEATNPKPSEAPSVTHEKPKADTPKSKTTPQKPHPKKTRPKVRTKRVRKSAKPKPPKSPAPAPKLVPEPVKVADTTGPRDAPASEDTSAQSPSDTTQKSEIASTTSGSGKKEAVGKTTRGASEPTRTAPNHGALRKGYMLAIYPHVRRVYFYPKIARRLGLEGRVLVSIEIDAHGQIVSVELHKKSPHAPLNKGAIEALRRIKHVPAPPAAVLGSRTTVRVIVPVNYALRGA